MSPKNIETHMAHNRYGLDKVELVSKKPVETIKKHVKKIRPISKDIGIVDVKEISCKPDKRNHNYDIIAYNQGYRTKVILTFISEQLFDLLAQVECSIGKPWLVEIYQDTVCENETDALQKANEAINFSCIRHIDRESFVYSTRNLKSQTKRNPPVKGTKEQYENGLYKIYQKQLEHDPTIIGDKTLYLGDKNDKLVFVVYARLSKFDEKPVVHREFRLKGYHLHRRLEIRKQGSSYLGSLKNLTTLKCEEIFKTLYRKNIKLYKINELEIFKHLLGWSYKKNLTDSEKQELQLTKKHIKDAEKLDCSSYYMKFFKKNDLDYRLFVEEQST